MELPEQVNLTRKMWSGIITKAPLIKSSTLDWLMSPTPPRVTLSTNQHTVPVLEHSCTLRTDSPHWSILCSSEAFLTGPSSYGTAWGHWLCKGHGRQGCKCAKPHRKKEKASQDLGSRPFQRWSPTSCFHQPRKSQKKRLAGPGVEFARWLFRLTH